MTKRLFPVGLVVVSLFLFGLPRTSAATTFSPVEYYNINGKGLAAHTQGAPVILSNAPDYDWWYGCSPTSAGMMMGYYDISGYGGLYYNRLIPGGQAELSTFPSTPEQWDYLAQSAIASPGHVNDFYPGGYGASGDDLDPPWHDFNSLADFMGTSQDSVDNSNGTTTFWFHIDGAPLYAADIYNDPSMPQDTSGMFGMWEYFDYAGYGSGDPSTDQNLFNQYVDTYKINKTGPPTYGQFAFADYMSEIDAGRVVMIHVKGHSMFGYGYDEGTETVYLHDTWSEGEHTMAWGGSYDGLELFGVTCFTPTEGAVPIPGAVWLLGSGLVGLVGLRRKFKG